LSLARTISDRRIYAAGSCVGEAQDRVQIGGFWCDRLACLTDILGSGPMIAGEDLV
jgi:hypothetical protein